MGRLFRSAAVFVAKSLLHRRGRWVFALTGLGLVAIVFGFGALKPSPPKEKLSAKDVRTIYAALLSHVEKGGPNHLHSRRLYYYAPPFAEAAGASADVVRTAALLHDATKEDGAGEPKERFCTHGEQGAELASKVVAELGKSREFNERTSAAVREHMGPCGFNLSWFSRRFMTKFCGRSFPKPESPEAKVLYDIDMLDLMTVDGVVKVAELRQKNPEFGKEPLEDSVKSGPDSAWKSVNDARQTLITDKARECGNDLTSHTQAFVDGLDFAKVKDITALKTAAADYLATKPLPACLPTVPPWRDGPMP